jgi:hypothetical protein
MAISFEEYKKNRLAGLSPQDAVKPQAKAEEGFSVGRTLGNVPKSAGDLIGGVVDAAVHPTRTLKAVGSVAAGGVEKLVPGKQAEEASFDTLVGHYKERYGSVDQFLKTLEDDPVGVLADASTVFGGAGAALKGAGAVSKTASLSNAGARAAGAAETLNSLAMTGAGISKAAQSTFPWVARTLEKSNLRLSPAAKRELGGKVDEITGFLSEKKIVGTPRQRFEKATIMYDKAEEALDGFFGSIAKGRRIPKESVVRGLQTLKGQYKNDRDSAVINRQIDSAINAIKKNQGDTIPYKNLNQFKRTTYNNAYNKAGDKVLDDVEHAIGDVAWNHLNEGLRGLKIAGQSYEQFNQNYGLLIQGRKLMRAAIGKPELSAITERLLASLIGGAVGGLPGAGADLAFGKAAFEAVPITAIRSGLGAAARTAAEAKVPATIGKAAVPTTAVERISEATQQ